MSVGGQGGDPAGTDAPRPWILVADDDEGNRTLLDRVLASRRFRARFAVDGIEALAMARDPSVDLVLLDHMMPGLTGAEVLHQLRAEGHDVPVIMLTAVGDPAQIAKVLADGADDYVTKPFSPVELLARVSRRLRVRPVARPAPSPSNPPPGGDLPSTEAMPLSSVVALLESTAAAPLRDPDAPSAEVVQTLRLDSTVGGEVGRPGDARPAGARLLPGDDELPARLMLGGRYELHEVLGRGAFGVVYRARHVDLETDVAVKVLRRGARSVEEGVSALESFRHEAVRACRLRHPNAVRVSDFGTTPGGQPYLVMELLSGESLEARIDATAERRLAPGVAAGIMEAVFRALHEAHAQGVIHQDVKAANIFLHREGGVEVPKLIDFGAAGERSRGTSSIVVGTATHMAPERFETGTFSPKTDCYAAGVTLYRAVTGRYPHMATDVHLLRKSHAEGAFAKPSTLRPELGGAWDALFARLLDVNPDARPTAADAAAALRALS